MQQQILSAVSLLAVTNQILWTPVQSALYCWGQQDISIPKEKVTKMKRTISTAALRNHRSTRQTLGTNRFSHIICRGAGVGLSSSSSLLSRYCSSTSHPIKALAAANYSPVRRHCPLNYSVTVWLWLALPNVTNMPSNLGPFSVMLSPAKRCYFSFCSLLIFFLSLVLSLMSLLDMTVSFSIQRSRLSLGRSSWKEQAGTISLTILPEMQKASSAALRQNGESNSGLKKRVKSWIQGFDRSLLQLLSENAVWRWSAMNSTQAKKKQNTCIRIELESRTLQFPRETARRVPEYREGLVALRTRGPMSTSAATKKRQSRLRRRVKQEKSSGCQRKSELGERRECLWPEEERQRRRGLRARAASRSAGSGQALIRSKTDICQPSLICIDYHQLTTVSSRMCSRRACQLPCDSTYRCYVDPGYTLLFRNTLLSIRSFTATSVSFFERRGTIVAKDQGRYIWPRRNLLWCILPRLLATTLTPLRNSWPLRFMNSLQRARWLGGMQPRRYFSFWYLQLRQAVGRQKKLKLSTHIIIGTSLRLSSLSTSPMALMAYFSLAMPNLQISARLWGEGSSSFMTLRQRMRSSSQSTLNTLPSMSLSGSLKKVSRSLQQMLGTGLYSSLCTPAQSTFPYSSLTAIYSSSAELHSKKDCSQTFASAFCANSPHLSLRPSAPFRGLRVQFSASRTLMTRQPALLAQRLMQFRIMLLPAPLSPCRKKFLKEGPSWQNRALSGTVISFTSKLTMCPPDSQILYLNWPAEGVGSILSIFYTSSSMWARGLRVSGASLSSSLMMASWMTLLPKTRWQYSLPQCRSVTSFRCLAMSKKRTGQLYSLLMYSRMSSGLMSLNWEERSTIPVPSRIRLRASISLRAVGLAIMEMRLANRLWQRSTQPNIPPFMNFSTSSLRKKAYFPAWQILNSLTGRARTGSRGWGWTGSSGRTVFLYSGLQGGWQRWSITRLLKKALITSFLMLSSVQSLSCSRRKLTSTSCSIRGTTLVVYQLKAVSGLKAALLDTQTRDRSIVARKNSANPIFILTTNPAFY